MRIREKDWELLSAYLDNQLSERERSKLEMQIKGSSEMQQALAELRQTKTILRRSARVRAPRNFTLTPEMVGIRPRQHRAYPVLRLAMVVASFLFLLVFSGDLTGLIPGVPPVTANFAARQAEPEMAMAPSRPMGGGGFGGGGGVDLAPGTGLGVVIFATPVPDESSAKVMVAEAEVVVTQEVAAVVEPEANPSAEEPTTKDMAVAPTATPMMEVFATAPDSSRETLALEPTPELESNAAEQAVENAQALDAAQAETQPTSNWSRTLVTILEITLLVLVVAGAAGLYYLKNKII